VLFRSLFSNGGFEDGSFNGWTVEHGYNYNGLTLDEGGTYPVDENVSQDDYGEVPGWLPGPWSASDNSYLPLDDSYTPASNRAFITSCTGYDEIAYLLPVVKYNAHSARVNSRDYEYHATRISQVSTIAASDRDPADNRFHIRFAWAAVLEDPGHEPYAQPYFHITLKKVSDNTVLYSQFFYSGQPGITWQDNNVSEYGWKWIDWQEVDLDVTDNVAVGDAIRIELSAADCAYGGHGGYAYLDGFRSQASATTGSTTTTGFDLRSNALGNGGCSVVTGGKGDKEWTGSVAADMAIYLALYLVPVLILRRVHGVRRRTGRTAFFLLIAAASFLIAASTAQAGQISPKTQRFHLTTDGFGAVTLDSDETLAPGKSAFVLSANYVKRPINKGNTETLTIEEDRVHNLLTLEAAGAYGITPDLEIGIDIPYNLVQSGKDAGGADITSHNIGDVRANAKWRFFSKPGMGLALVPFIVLPTGDEDVFLSQKKFSYGARLAGRYAANDRLTLLANAGLELVNGFTKDGDSPDHYSAWVQFGAGATYNLPGPARHSLVGEINGETILDAPFHNQIVTPIEWLIGYKRLIGQGVTLEVGGGRGFNKGVGAPQWRAYVGVAYLK
jgi:hypothetical protein